MVDLSILEFPLSLILAAAFVFCVVMCRKTAVARFFISKKLSSILIVLAAVFLSVEGTWGFGLFRHWSFVTVMVLVLASLCFTALTDLKKKSYYAMTCHLGLALVLFGGLFGAPDRTDVQMRVFRDAPAEYMATDTEGYVVQLPFGVVLKDFTIDYYDDSKSPRQFTSILSVDGKELKTSVNHPCRYKGYRFYQTGCDIEGGSYSVLKIVRNPWMPVLALGALLLALSAILGLKETWKSRKLLAAALALAVIFAIISVARINFGTLVPALRSLWFVPHLIIYMLAYSIMALSLIAWVASLFTGKVPAQLSGKLLSTASSLLLVGMLCGAVWAQQAWGSYWTWDAKECWAAATWLLTLAGTHVPKKKHAPVFTVLAFLAIQITWYGVNYLPSSAQSLHTYNQEQPSESAAAPRTPGV